MTNRPEECFKVLVVDDDPGVASVVAHVIHQAGALPLPPASSAEGARLLASRERPEFAILDVSIDGDEDGVDLALWLRARGLPFLFLTASADRCTERRMREAGPTAVLRKPPDLQEIRRLLCVRIGAKKSAPVR